MGEEWEDKNKKTFCPVKRWDCPFYEKNGKCSLENVKSECDDFYFFKKEEKEKLDYNKWRKKGDYY